MENIKENDSPFIVEINDSCYFLSKPIVLKLLDLVDVQNRRVRVKLKNGSEINGKYIEHVHQIKIIPFNVNVPIIINIKTNEKVETFITPDFESFEVDENQY